MADSGLVFAVLVCIDVEEDGGGGVQDVRGEAPDEPRPAHQRHGLRLSAKLRHAMIEPFRSIGFL